MNSRIYRVLAADDEYWSRENIRNLLPWEEYSFEFLEPACDGEEVLERIPEEQPDILLTDSNMPFLNGLVMLERIHKEYPEIITVAISGYDDFQKVKGVFISGGIDYLLKPVGKEELIAVLTKALGILEERAAKKEQDESIRQQEYRLSSYLEDGEYSALLSQKLYGGGDAQPHVSSTRTFSEVATVMVKFYDITEIAALWNHDALTTSFNIKSRLRELFGDTGKTVIFNYRNKMSEFLLAGAADAAKLARFAANVLKEFPLEEYGPVSVVLHEQASSLDDIGTIYREMIAALMTRPFGRSHSILHCLQKTQKPEECGNDFHMDSRTAPLKGQTQPDAENAQDGISACKGADIRLEDELSHLLSANQKSAAERLIFDASGFISCEEDGWTYLDVKQYVGRVTNILYGFVRNQMPELTAQIEESMENIDYYMKCLDAKSVISSLRILLGSLWANDSRKDSDSVMAQVEHIHAYIEKSYYETFTLTSLAEQYHVDASYLSRTFSKAYGETITAFLTRTRMEHAIELMRDPDRKLETISMLVGYDDYNYFSRVFRKKMGVSPSEYRGKILC